MGNEADKQTLIRYACMPRSVLTIGSLSVEAVQPEHTEPIRQWRNSQMDVLRQTDFISVDEQERYYRKHVWPETSDPNPDKILLAYKDNDKLIGYGGLVHIAWLHRRAEVSFLVASAVSADEDLYFRYFSGFLQLMRKLAFEDLKFKRLFTETYAFRERHMSILERSGFCREGVLRHHIRIDDQPVDSIIHGCLATYERSEINAG